MSTLQNGQQIEQYRVEYLIKANPYCETYRIADENGTPFFLKLYIIKNTPKRLLDDNGEVKEIAICSTLAHKNIISYVSSGQMMIPEGVGRYMITVYFSGELLSEHIARLGKLPLDEATNLFKEILAGLDYLHTQEPRTLLHNDITPSNIMLSETTGGTPELIDMGHVSPPCGGNPKFDTSDLDVEYCSSQTFVGMYDEKSDLFAAAAVFYTMLTGHAPWHVEMDAELTRPERIKRVKEARKQELDLTDVDKSIHAFLKRALVANYDDRYGSAKQMLRALEDPNNEEAPKSGSARTRSDRRIDSEEPADETSADVEVRRGSGKGFEDIAGMQELKDMLRTRVIFILKDKEMAEKYRLTPPNGMLLYGPPGCGKSFFAEKFAEETGFNFILVKASDLGSIYVHGTQGKIADLFKKAEKNRPTVLCFDEFDAFVPNRSDDLGNHHSGEVNELSHTNNTSQMVDIRTVAPYSVTVATNKTKYKQGETVVITGQLTGNNTASTAIDLYIINEGARQVFPVTTDEQGAFRYEYTPYSLQSGHFIVGACYPGEGLTTQMAAFDIYGLRRVDNDYITCDTKLGEEYVGTIMIENPGQRQQTINSFVVVSKPDGCNVVLEKPNTIAANGTAQLKYKLTGTAVTETKDWEIIQLKVTTSQGSSLPITLYYYCSAQHAVLTANTNSIKTTMTKGATREYLLNVMNTGKAPSGKVTVQLPNVSWMQLGSPAEMSSLECGETATVCLRLTPTADMPLNVPYTGRIALNCENGDGVSVSYQIEVVSESTGTLTIDVVDEYTYYTEEKPHVAGAGIVVKHPVTGAIVTQGTTGSDGLFSVVLPEGFYNISVTESHHNSVTGNILVDPGTTNYQEVFLPYNAISYSWDVVETEVEDEYAIETVVTYETNVPKPVVIVNLPTEQPADNSIVAIVVTNKGLINAQHMTMNLDCSEGYEFVLLNPEELEVLAPQQSHVFYARFQKKTTQNSKRNAWGDPDSDCISIFAGALYDYMCGNAKNFGSKLARRTKWPGRVEETG